MNTLILRFISKWVDSMQEKPFSGHASAMRSPEKLRGNQGFSGVAIVAALVILCVIVSGVVLFFKSGPEEITESKIKTEVEEVDVAVTPLHVPSEGIEPLDKEKNLVSKAEEALEDGEFDLARELTNDAFEQELLAMQEMKEENGTAEDVAARKREEILSVLRKMWGSHAKINETQENVEVATEGSGPEEPLDNGPSGPGLLEPDTEDDLPNQKPFYLCLNSLGLTESAFIDMADSDVNNAVNFFFSEIYPCMQTH